MSLKIRCIAVDDEPMALDKLKNYIERIPYLEVAGLCNDTYEAMQVLSAEKVDAMFIDINMPDVNGLDFVKALADPPLIIFTTAYSEYAVDSYKVRAVDYLLKPFGFSDFQHSAESLLKQFNLLHTAVPSAADSEPTFRTDPERLYLKVDYRYIKVELDDIIYIEGMNEYLKVHTITGDPFLTHTTFKHIIKFLPDFFVQVHRSYLVNMKHVNEVERSVVLLSDGTRISVSDGNKDNFMQYLQSHSIRK